MVDKFIESTVFGYLTVYREPNRMKNNNPFFRIKSMYGSDPITLYCEVTYQILETSKILLLEIRTEDTSGDRFGYNTSSQYFRANIVMNLKEWMNMFEAVPTPLKTQMTDILYE